MEAYMAPEDELASVLNESKSIKRDAIQALHRNLLIRYEYQLLVRQARAIREDADDTRECAIRVREEALQKLSEVRRTLQPQIPHRAVCIFPDYGI
jgi:DNA-binding FadR family transcriptional regulator